MRVVFDTNVFIAAILSGKFKLPQPEISTSMEIINEALADIISSDMPLISICKDRDDNKIIACAVAAKAHYLVTGDAELLGLKQYKNVKIISPRDLEMLFK